MVNLAFFNCKLKPPHPFHRTNFINFEYFIYASTHVLTGNPGEKIEFNALNFRMDYLTIWTGINIFESFYDGEKVAGAKRVDSRNNLAHLCNNCEHQMNPYKFPNFNKQLLMLLLILTFDKMNIKPDYMATILKRNPKFHLTEN